jgi:hypothetical protein
MLRFPHLGVTLVASLALATPLFTGCGGSDTASTAGTGAAGTGGATGTGGGAGGGNATSTGSAGAPPTTADFYVAPNGDDCAPPACGTLEKPFKTPGFASQQVAALRAAQPKRAKEVVVMFRDGLYDLSAAPWAFTDADSGTDASTTLYLNYPNETPILSGGRVVTNFSDSCADCDGVWIADLGEPGAGGWRTFPVLYAKSSKDSDFARIDRPFTTSDYLTFGTAQNAQQRNSYDVPPNTDGSSPDPTNCPVAANSPLDLGNLACYDRFFFNPGEICYKPDATNRCPAAWACLAQKSCELADFEQFSAPRMFVDHVCEANACGAGCSQAHPCAFLTGDTTEGTAHGMQTGSRWLMTNVIEAFVPNGKPKATPGKMFLDASNASNWRLEYVPKTGEKLADMTFVAPQATSIVTTSGTPGLRNVRFEGLTFSFANFVVPAKGFVSSQYEPRLTPAALSLLNTGKVSFERCTVSHAVGQGVELLGNDGIAGEGDAFEDSAVYDVSGGIRIDAVGHLDASGALRLNGKNGDDDSVVSHDNLIRNNVFAGTGVFFPTAEPVIIAEGYANTVADNDITNTAHGAVSIGFGFGKTAYSCHDNVIQNNDASKITQGVTDDGGCYYADSDPTDADMTSKATNGNNVLDHNRCADLWRSTKPKEPGAICYGLYLDEHSSHWVVKDNVVQRADGCASWTPGTVQSGPGGADNLFTNNIFAFCRQGPVRENGPGPAMGKATLEHNVWFWDSPLATLVDNSFFGCDGGACTQYFVFDQNDYFYLGGQYHFQIQSPPALPGCPSTGKNLTFADWQKCGEDPNSVTTDPGFAHDPCSAAPLQVKASVASAIGFSQVSPTFGRTSAIIKAPAVAMGFPTQSVKLACDAF